MNKTILFSSLITLGLMASCSQNASKTEDAQTAAKADSAAQAFVMDTAGSTMEWFASKVTGKHNGTLKIKSGELKIQGEKLVAGNFVVDMNTIKVTDITDAESNSKLAAHLNSEDFFNTAANPEALFELVSAEPIANAAANAPNYNLKGNLTIKGITKAISFPATVQITADAVNASAEFPIDRTEWDIKYGSGKFFKDLADKAINDNFDVKLNISAKKAS
jgi:polyisoprenoid-binding protein YceI